MPFIIIAYSLITLAWQGITGAPPPWTDWFAAHLLLIVLAVLCLSQSHRAAAYDKIVRWRTVTPGRNLGDGPISFPPFTSRHLVSHAKRDSLGSPEGAAHDSAKPNNID